MSPNTGERWVHTKFTSRSIRMTISPNGRKTEWWKRKEQTTVSIVECHIFQVCTRLRYIYSRAGNCKVSYVHSYQVQKTCLRINYFRFSPQPWRGAALAPTIVCGVSMPKPSAYAPSSHHGRWWLCLVCVQSRHSLSSITHMAEFVCITFILCRSIDDRCHDHQQ